MEKNRQGLSKNRLPEKRASEYNLVKNTEKVKICES
jgi:hypothetical protein